MAFKYPKHFTHGSVVTGASIDANFSALWDAMQSLDKSNFRASAAIPNKLKQCAYSWAPFSTGIDKVIVQPGSVKAFHNVLAFTKGDMPDTTKYGKPIVDDPFYIHCASAFYSGCVNESAADRILITLSYLDGKGNNISVDPIEIGDEQRFGTTGILADALSLRFGVKVQFETDAGGAARTFRNLTIVVWTLMRHLR